MGDEFIRTKVAVVQAAPVLLDREATTAKAVDLIGEAAAKGAKLVLFPEAFIPGYLWGTTLGTVIGSRTEEGRAEFARYWANTVEVPSLTTRTLAAAARQHGIYVAIGVIERDREFSGGTLYCTLLYFGPDGRLLGKHRKLKPTAAERYIWGDGDGSTMPVLETELGKLGGLICWENYMPLARAAMYGQGVQVYLAPTADNRDTWQSTIRHIACEGRVFVLSCCQVLHKDQYPDDFRLKAELESAADELARGGSAIISPLGEYLAGPLYSKEGILVAELDFATLAGAKFDMDVTGHYSRADMLQLVVNRERNRPMLFTGGNDYLDVDDDLWDDDEPDFED